MKAGVGSSPSVRRRQGHLLRRSLTSATFTVAARLPVRHAQVHFSRQPAGCAAIGTCSHSGFAPPYVVGSTTDDALISGPPGGTAACMSKRPREPPGEAGGADWVLQQLGSRVRQSWSIGSQAIHRWSWRRSLQASLKPTLRARATIEALGESQTVLSLAQ